ncbi:MAG: deoxyguanosinetriphosphate triphosphohydrolase [Bacteroides sp.]|nr:deoxyguanosinetriphosphate triphosphohydrolase [Bacteroides sp.]MCM1420575.1 deoxyguanosinetriphosphate triphosphohydrolase [Bacteroides sp.]
MNWERLISNKRLGQEESHYKRKDDRTEFKRDYDRLIFSAPFRRLQNKTQVFPLPGSVFVHNRLTHSLEVASVGRSLGDDVARRLLGLYPELASTHISEIGDIVSAACLAHDMGNPPFGHSGEKAIATYFSEGSGLKYKDMVTAEQWQDLIHYEGNANAFRLLTHQFTGRRKGGFVMTYSMLASIVKYPFRSSFAGDKQKFGFFQSEEETYKKIAGELGIVQIAEGRYARHPLVYLVEAADDICYEIMDIEDAHKLKLLSTEETKDILLAFFDEERRERICRVFDEVTDINEQIVYLRSCVIGKLESECVTTFVNHERQILSGEFQGPLIKSISPSVYEAYSRCMSLSVSKIYQSKDVVDIELAGYKIITTLIDLFATAAMEPEKAYSKLLLRRVSSQYDVHSENVYTRLMAVLDFVSGMTDIFALDLIRKINGERIPVL